MMLQKTKLLDFLFSKVKVSRSHSGRFESKFIASSGEFSQIREYIPGESAARIDWKKSHFDLDKLSVREYTDEVENTLIIAVIVEPGFRFGTLKFTKVSHLLASVTLLIESAWNAQLRGQIYVLDANGVQKLDFPIQQTELQSLIKALKNKILSSVTSPSSGSVQELYTRIASEYFDGGIVIFGEFRNDVREQFLSPSMHILEISISHPEEEKFFNQQNAQISKEDGPLGTLAHNSRRVRMILSTQDDQHTVFQRAFDLW